MFPRLTQLDKPTTRALNVLTHQCRCAPFTLQGEEYAFRLVDSGRKKEYIGVVELKLNGHLCSIGLFDYPQLYLEQLQLNFIDLNALPPRLAAIAFQRACDGWLKLLQNKFNIHLEFVDFQLGHTQVQAQHQLPFSLHNHSSDIWLSGVLYMNDSVLNWLTQRWTHSHIEAYQSFDGLSMPLSLQIGQQRLTWGEWNSLQPNDIILFDPLHQTQNECLVSLQEQVLFSGIFNDNQLLVQQSFFMNVNDPTRSAMTIDDLSVQLQFSLGTTALTLGQLKSIKPGYTFELPISKEGPIHILAFGQKIAEGLLVEVGDRLGVRLIEHTVNLEQKTGLLADAPAIPSQPAPAIERTQEQPTDKGAATSHEDLEEDILLSDIEDLEE